jgi:hypothetical protein
MKYISYILRSILIITLFPCIMFDVSGFPAKELPEKKAPAWRRVMSEAGAFGTAYFHTPYVLLPSTRLSNNHN